MQAHFESLFKFQLNQKNRCKAILHLFFFVLRGIVAARLSSCHCHSYVLCSSMECHSVGIIPVSLETAL